MDTGWRCAERQEEEAPHIAAAEGGPRQKQSYDFGEHLPLALYRVPITPLWSRTQLGALPKIF
jgi:hypothetical protein